MLQLGPHDDQQATQVACNKNSLETMFNAGKRRVGKGF